MLTKYFKRQTTQAVYYSGPAGPYLDEFTIWLEHRGYQHESIRRRLHGATQFVTWVQNIGCDLQSLSPITLDNFRCHLINQDKLFRSRGQHSARWLGAQLIFQFFQDEQIVASANSSPEIEHPELLKEFEQWMHIHRGVMQSTLYNYRPHIMAFLGEFETCPEGLGAKSLRASILTYAQHRSTEQVKARVTAIRMFLRFLTAMGRCQSGIDAAIPAIAQWRLATLPRYLVPEDVERVIAACDDTTYRNVRNKAIILLLARLGLRAGDVANLKISDIDWPQGTFTVMGKSRREAKLPLPQEVGDSLLDYLRTARPIVNLDQVFITTIAPWKPITSNVVSQVAAQAIKRAGIKASSYGAHVLRHSAATSLLREGSSLQVIGEILRHRSVETTAHYAKVDVALLQQVTIPWPGGVSC